MKKHFRLLQFLKFTCGSQQLFQISAVIIAETCYIYMINVRIYIYIYTKYEDSFKVTVDLSDFIISVKVIFAKCFLVMSVVLTAVFHRGALCPNRMQSKAWKRK